jgi:lipoprotein-anchoring transpeptidase ErfK/SrfK
MLGRDGERCAARARRRSWQPAAVAAGFLLLAASTGAVAVAGAGAAHASTGAGAAQASTGAVAVAAHASTGAGAGASPAQAGAAQASTGAVAVAVAAQASASPRVAAAQQVVAMLASHAVRGEPRGGGRLVATVAARRPITGARTVLPVLAQTVDRGGRFWLRVRLPGRTLKSRPPAAGWISASQTSLSTTPWHIVVDLGARRVAVYSGGQRLRSFRAIVGRRATPTPRGEYFVEEDVRVPANQAGAPFALALSARSHVLQEFEGGPGQIALHGLANIGGQLGSAVSHGCVRLTSGDVTWLAEHIDAGVPVSIV